MNMGGKNSSFLIKLVPTLILISLLAWCTANNRARQNSMPALTELRELFMENGLIDNPNTADLAGIAEKIGESGMNRLLYEAAPGASVEVLKWLVNHGAVPSNVGAMTDLPLLHRAAQSPRYDRLEYLLSFGLDPLERSREGLTLLHVAARGGLDERVLQLLTSHGLKVGDASKTGLRPIHLASVKSIPVLIAAGADINAKDEDGRTALHRAAREGRNDVVAELIRNNASVHSTDNRGRTPLHLAAMATGADAVIETLLAAGAMKSTRDNDGMTARDLAIEARETRSNYVSTIDKL